MVSSISSLQNTTPNEKQMINCRISQ